MWPAVEIKGNALGLRWLVADDDAMQSPPSPPPRLLPLTTTTTTMMMTCGSRRDMFVRLLCSKKGGRGGGITRIVCSSREPCVPRNAVRSVHDAAHAMLYVRSSQKVLQSHCRPREKRRTEDQLRELGVPRSLPTQIRACTHAQQASRHLRSKTSVRLVLRIATAPVATVQPAAAAAAVRPVHPRAPRPGGVGVSTTYPSTAGRRQYRGARGATRGMGQAAPCESADRSGAGIQYRMRASPRDRRRSAGGGGGSHRQFHPSMSSDAL